MRRLATLLLQIEADRDAAPTALASYFRATPDDDLLAVLPLLSGQGPKRRASRAELTSWAATAAGLPPWLIAESAAFGGDLAEALALILPDGDATPGPASALARLNSTDDPQTALRDLWPRMTAEARWVLNRIVLGNLRLRLPLATLAGAICAARGGDPAAVAESLAGAAGRPDTLATLLAPNRPVAAPHPFAQALPLTEPPHSLGPAAGWRAEPLHPGLGAQIVRRPHASQIWSRTGEPLLPRFPELAPLVAALPPDTVLAGIIQVWRDETPGPLGPRATPRQPSRKQMADWPVRFLAHDLAEIAGEPVGDQPLAQRDARRHALIAALPPGLPLAPAPRLRLADWAGLDPARDGPILLKRGAAPFPGDWRLWRPQARRLRAVLVYLDPGRGTVPPEGTFALADAGGLIPVGRAPLSLPPDEIATLLGWMRRATEDRFGPVRRVAAEQVFELTYAQATPNARRKAGVTLQDLRCLRWLPDTPPAEIDSLNQLTGI